MELIGRDMKVNKSYVLKFHKLTIYDLSLTIA
jgi:hypothetical protein